MSTKHLAGCSELGLCLPHMSKGASRILSHPPPSLRTLQRPSPESSSLHIWRPVLLGQCWQTSVCKEASFLPHNPAMYSQQWPLCLCVRICVHTCTGLYICNCVSMHTEGREQPPTSFHRNSLPSPLFLLLDKSAKRPICLSLNH